MYQLLLLYLYVLKILNVVMIIRLAWLSLAETVYLRHSLVCYGCSYRNMICIDNRKNKSIILFPSIVKS